MYGGLLQAGLVRQRTLEAVKQLMLRESQVQPLLVVFEDLHWIDSETQAVLDSLVESLPTARILLLEEHLTTAATMYREMDMHFWLEQAKTDLGPPNRNLP